MIKVSDRAPGASYLGRNAIKNALFAAVLLASAVATSACRSDTNAQQAPKSRFERLALSSEVRAPTLSQDVILAGTPIIIDCDRAEHVDVAENAIGAAQPLRVGHAEMYPEVAPSEVEGSRSTFVPTQAGSYATHCVVDRDGSYAAGPILEVRAGAAHSITVTVDSGGNCAAGTALQVTCTAEDAFNNGVALPLPSGLGEPAVIYTVAGKQVALDDAGLLSIDSRLSGAVDIQCQVPTWPSVPVSEAVTLEVTPSTIEAVYAHVDGMFYGAHETVDVRCTGVDTYGQERPLPEAVVQVLDGEATVNGQTFFADKAGQYRVLCTMAEAVAHDGSHTQALTSAPTTVDVAPGVPARWDVRWHATGKCQSQTTPLPIIWRMFDAYGNVLNASYQGPQVYDAVLTTEPATPLQRNAVGGYTIPAHGSYKIKLTATGPGTSVLPVVYKDVVVNSSPPDIVITSPGRAAMVQSNDATVMLRGYVKSAFGPLNKVTIHGVELHEASGRQSYDFTVPYNSQWGLNIIQGIAEDACGNEAILTQSFLHSDAFAPVAAADDDAARVSQAVRARFGQATWDDGDPNTLQDVATLMQMALESSSLDERLPDRLGAWPQDDGTGALPSKNKTLLRPFAGKIDGVEVVRNGPLDLQHPTLHYLRTVDGGWDVAFSLEDLVVPFVAHQYLHGGILGTGVVLDVPGTLSTHCMRVEAHIGVAIENGVPKATVNADSFHLTFAEGVPNLNLSGLKYVPDALKKVAQYALPNLPQMLAPIIETRIRQEMVSQMDIFLGGLQLHHSLPLPRPFETTLQVKSGLDGIDMHGPRGQGYGDFSLFTQIVAPTQALQVPLTAPFSMEAPAYGPIVRKPIPRVPLTLHGDQSFALAVHDDLFNQMLYALWAEGAFTRQFTAQGPSGFDEDPAVELQHGKPTQQAAATTTLLDAANLDLFFMSPPVVMPGDEDNEIVLAIGDAWARAELMPKETSGTRAKTAEPLRAGFFFSTVIRAHVDIDAVHGHLLLTPKGSPELFLQVNPVEPAVMTGAVHHWLSKTLKKRMPEYMSETLRSFPLPQLAIGRIPGVPKDAVWVPDTGTLERPAQGAEVVVQGTLRGARAQPSAD